MIRRVSLLLLLCASAVGCKHIAGPREAWDKPRPDQPGLTIEEQERRGRDKYATFEDDQRIGPNTYNSRPSPIGR